LPFPGCTGSPARAAPAATTTAAAICCAGQNACGSAGSCRLVRLPAIAHAVDRVDMVEVRVQLQELLADALYVRGDGAVVDEDARLLHQGITAFDMPGELGHGVQHPELRNGQLH